MTTSAPVPVERTGVPHHAVITGSDSGIEEAVAIVLAGGGVDVGITYNEDIDYAERAAERARDAGAEVYVGKLDLTDLPASADIVDELATNLGGLDILVNCAGNGTNQPIMEMDFDLWHRVVAVDLDGAFLCSQHAARQMIRAGRGGRIINIMGAHGHSPREGAAPYHTAKAGLTMLTRMLALELAEHGITVNSIAPAETSAHTARHAREIAAAAAFLAMPAAGHITGSSIVVDGGMLLMGSQGSQQLTVAT